MVLSARTGLLICKRVRGGFSCPCYMRSCLISLFKVHQHGLCFPVYHKRREDQEHQSFLQYHVSINLHWRILSYSKELSIPEDKFAFEFFIPKFHLPTHGSSCHTKYLFNYWLGVGHTHRENIEFGWAHTNPAAISTWEIGASTQHSTLNGHWGGWTVVLIIFLILSREDLWILRAWSQGLLNPPKGPRFLSRLFKHFFKGGRSQ